MLGSTYAHHRYTLKGCDGANPNDLAYIGVFHDYTGS